MVGENVGIETSGAELVGEEKMGNRREGPFLGEQAGLRPNFQRRSTGPIRSPLFFLVVLFGLAGALYFCFTSIYYFRSSFILDGRRNERPARLSP